MLLETYISFGESFVVLRAFMLSNFRRIACRHTEHSHLPLNSVDRESTRQPEEQSQEFPSVLPGLIIL